MVFYEVSLYYRDPSYFWLSDKMEVNPQNIQQLAAYLQQTLSPQNEVRKPAEEFLQSVEVNQNYPVLLLHLLQSDGIEPNIKVYGNTVKFLR